MSSNPNSPVPLDLDQILDNEVLQKEQEESLEETMQSVLNNIDNVSSLHLQFCRKIMEFFMFSMHIISKY